MSKHGEIIDGIVEQVFKHSDYDQNGHRVFRARQESISARTFRRFQQQAVEEAAGEVFCKTCNELRRREQCYGEIENGKASYCSVCDSDDD